MRHRIAQLLGRAALGAVLLAALPSAALAGLLEREIVFSEAEVQAAIERKGPLSRNYGGLASVSIEQAPKVTLGQPEGRLGLAGSMQIAIAGQAAIPVDVQTVAGIRYDDRSKAFYLENPVATSVSSPHLEKSAEPFIRQGITQLMNSYARSRPIYVLKESGSAEELAARWLLRSIRIEAGRVIATLSPF